MSIFKVLCLFVTTGEKPETSKRSWRFCVQSFDASSPYRSAVLPSFLASLLVQDGGLVTCGSPQVTQSFQYYRIFRLIFRSFCGIFRGETGNIFKKSRKDVLRHFFRIFMAKPLWKQLKPFAVNNWGQARKIPRKLTKGLPITGTRGVAAASPAWYIICLWHLQQMKITTRENTIPNTRHGMTM